MKIRKERSRFGFQHFFSRGNGGRYPYYHCHNKTCLMYGKGISKRDLERDFAEYLKKITPKRKFLAIFKETISELWNDMKNKFSLRAQNYERQIALLEEKRKRIFEMREEGSYTKEDFLERKQEIKEDIAANKMSLRGKTIDDFDIQGALSCAIGFIQDFGRQWMKLSYRL